MNVFVDCYLHLRLKYEGCAGVFHVPLHVKKGFAVSLNCSLPLNSGLS